MVFGFSMQVENLFRLAKTIMRRRLAMSKMSLRQFPYSVQGVHVLAKGRYKVFMWSP